MPPYFFKLLNMPNNIFIDNIRSQEVQEILTKVPNWMIRWGNTLVLVIIFFLLCLSWFIKYPDIITADAVITTQLPPEKLYAKSSGKFDAILVDNNSLVSSNQVLAIIQNSASYKDVLFLQSIIDSIDIYNNEFQFPIENLPPLILGDITPVFSQFENDYNNYLLNANLAPFESQKTTDKLSVIEAQYRLKTLINQQEISKKELAFKEKDLERNRYLFNQGVISQQSLETAELDFLQTTKSYKSLLNHISQTRDLINSSNNNKVSTIIKEKQESLNLKNRALQSFLYLKNAVNDWLLKYAFVSSENGRVSFFSVWNKNQKVNTNDLVFTVIPLANNNNFIAKIKAPVLNSGKIKIGQSVQISVANYPSEEYGELIGEINQISLLPDDDNNYLIDVLLPNKLVTTYNKEIIFNQEMIGSANIITKDLRLIQRFFNQFSSLIN